MEKQQSAGETINDQKKEWYKNGWGILVTVLIFPYFLLWYMWTKTDWSKNVKWVITVIFALANISALAGNATEQQTATPAQSIKVEETKATDTQTPTTPQVPQFTFDVPSLIGKNIDEIKTILGNPTTFKEPTKQQLAMTDTWDMEYTKDENTLMITYNPKSKVVLDYFIDGTDKNKLLTVGNLKENSNDYSLNFIQSVKNSSEITGVTISKKLPQELSGDVTYNAVAFKVDNTEDFGWANCKFEINGGTFSSGYTYKSDDGIKAKGNVIIPFSEFTKDGNRFNFYEQKPENLFISCDTNGQHRNNYFTLK